jgi:hypothetical protein
VLAALSALSALSALLSSLALSALSGLLALLAWFLLAAALTTLIGIAHDRSCVRLAPTMFNGRTQENGSWELAAHTPLPARPLCRAA